MLTRHGYTSTLLKGEYGTKEAFRNAGRWDNPEGVPHLLHLSTHGYFYPETPDETIEDISGTGLAYNISNHPMLRTGLIFAGVNLPENPEENSDRQTEGILTAYEISQLNLAQTDLVVLSACETGLGDIKGSEGVYGLQRAFKIAGAKQIISSLWQVPDFQTYELMDFFYKGYLEENMSPREALTYARDKMRKKRYEPFYWAGFVLME